MQKIVNSIKKAALNLGYEAIDYAVMHPKDESHGDVSTNVALVLAKKTGKNPRQIAEKIITSLQNDIEVNRMIDKVEVAGPGFINMFFRKEWLVEEVEQAVKDTYGTNKTLSGKKVMVEYTDPNPFKEMHIGHLMSNTIGESIARLNEARGAEVKRANYQGDVGLHVAKSIWGLLRKFETRISKFEIEKWIEVWEKKPVHERQKMMGQAYAAGATKYEESEAAKTEMHELNKKIYQQTDPAINAIYQAGREWSLAYFETIYRRLGTKFDEYFFESQAGKIGLEVVEEGLEKKILEIGEEGAVVYRGEKEGLHTRVFRNKLGLPTYEAKDLGLAKSKYDRYPYNLSYIVTANEITEYFKVVLTVMGKLYPELRAKTTHVPHGIMKLPTGKMSSRTGKVVTAENLLDELKEAVLLKMGERAIDSKEQVADKIAVGALKFAVLRQQIGGDIVYEPEKMTALEGATGPFVQYTYARIQSVLAKTKKIASSGKLQGSDVNKDELNILRWIYRYPEVVSQAAEGFAPHILAGYLTELASRFNTFYNRNRIADGENRDFRLQMTKAVGQTLRNGLHILGIESPREM